jgi:hypothetical protein
MKIRTLTSAGRRLFGDWLKIRTAGQLPPIELISGATETAALLDVEVDPDRLFATRFEFAQYMLEVLSEQNIKEMLSSANDDMWNWLTVLYFSQIGKKQSKYWHYVVTRSGHAGSLGYRHIVRTSYEMFWRHGDNSLVMLNVNMSTWGDMSEQLTSRQNVAWHRGYIATAKTLYLADGKLKKGSAGRVPPASKRRANDKRGKGGVGRMALAARRLSRTYDTYLLDAPHMISLLPKEFAGFARVN